MVRRGFGRSEGALPFALRGCRDGDYGPMLDQQADDLEAALRALAKRPDVNADQALALGISVGGATALALGARPPDGLRAVINVSGRVRPVQADGSAPVPCKPEDLAPTFARLGERSRVPSLWLYAENDSLFPGDYVRQLHEAYVSKGGPTDFHMFESLGKDGHEMAGTVEGALRWLPALDRFLRANRLPTYDPAPLDAAVAALNLGNSPARLVAARYAGRPTEKVLTVAPASRGLHAKFGGTDLAELERQAIAECAERLKAPCRVLLRNFEVALPPAAAVLIVTVCSVAKRGR